MGMKNIFCILGKTGSGKSTVVDRLYEQNIGLPKVILHTTRPIRSNETNGVEYYFDSYKDYEGYLSKSKIISNIVRNNWHYYVIYDDIDKCGGDCILSNACPEIFKDLRCVYGNSIVPIYIGMSDNGVRLGRMLKREKGLKNPDYNEMCRRYISDEVDYSHDVLECLKIDRMFENNDIDSCVSGISRYIYEVIGGGISENELSA